MFFLPDYRFAGLLNFYCMSGNSTDDDPDIWTVISRGHLPAQKWQMNATLKPLYKIISSDSTCGDIESPPSGSPSKMSVPAL